MTTQETGLPSGEAGIRKKPFLCNVIASIALTYFLILALLFLAGLIFSGKIASIIEPYYLPGRPFVNDFFWFALTGTLLSFLASSGIILFMLGRQTGFYIFFVSFIIIMALDLTFLKFDWLRYLINTGLFFLLGLAFISKKCHA